ncbi:MAG: hypothetical protein IJ558_04495 [Treponema sp.]|nr:hypothetical protein [Treponema sp.]
MCLCKKRTFFLLLTVFFCLLSPLSAYERVPVVLDARGIELHTSFYCFNDFSEGKKIAEELFHVRRYDELARGKRERMIPVPLGTRVGYYDYAIFCYGAEFWLFENKNGFLWGRGTLLDSPRNQ